MKNIAKINLSNLVLFLIILLTLSFGCKNDLKKEDVLKTFENKVTTSSKKLSCPCGQLFDLSGNFVENNYYSNIQFISNNMPPTDEDIMDIYSVEIPCVIEKCGVIVVDKNGRKIFRIKESNPEKYVYVFFDPFFKNGVFFCQIDSILMEDVVFDSVATN